MRRIKAKNLARDLRLDARRTMADLQEAFELGREGESGGIVSEDFSIRDLATNLLHFREGGGDAIGGHTDEIFSPSDPGVFVEAMSAIDSTAFANITGQLIVNSVMQGYQGEEFVATRLIPDMPTKLDGEKIPGISPLKAPADARADGLIVREGEEYPKYGIGETYLTTPSTTKRGLGTAVTKEAVFFDRTSLVLQRAGDVGMHLGLNKEKRLLNMIIGATNNYNRNGTAFDTYSSEISGGWINHRDWNALTDWTDVDKAEELFTEMLDPDTSEPILIGGRTIFACPQKRMTVGRILTATETRSGTGNVVIAGNPLSSMGLGFETSRLLYARLRAADGMGLAADSAKDYWFYGDFARAFA